MATQPLSHEPTFRRHTLGKSPVSGRPLTGYTVECSCGDYRERINAPKREAHKAWRAHVRAAEAGSVRSRA